MGFSTVNTVMFSMDMKQTPENVAKVIDIAGWTFQEAAKETGIHHARLNAAMHGSGRLTDAEWQFLLDKAGRRSFDHDGDAA